LDIDSFKEKDSSTLTNIP